MIIKFWALRIKQILRLLNQNGVKKLLLIVLIALLIYALPTKVYSINKYMRL